MHTGTAVLPQLPYFHDLCLFDYHFFWTWNAYMCQWVYTNVDQVKNAIWQFADATQPLFCEKINSLLDYWQYCANSNGVYADYQKCKIKLMSKICYPKQPFRANDILFYEIKTKEVAELKSLINTMFVWNILRRTWCKLAINQSEMTLLHMYKQTLSLLVTQLVLRCH